MLAAFINVHTAAAGTAAAAEVQCTVLANTAFRTQLIRRIHTFPTVRAVMILIAVRAACRLTAAVVTAIADPGAVKHTAAELTIDLIIAA